MGWGICFALDENGYVFCADGCRWRARKADYVDYPPWPSARQAVVDYFERRDVHSELDMIRDECPGTAAALKEACEEHIGSALGEYDRWTDEEKQAAHDEAMAGYTSDLERVTKELSEAWAAYQTKKKAWTAYKKNPPKYAPAKTRADEIRQLMAPLQMELEVEDLAAECDHLRRVKTRTTKMLNLEKKFTLDQE